MAEDPRKKNQRAPEKDRDLRLKKALRENLRRRKRSIAAEGEAETYLPRDRKLAGPHSN